MTGELGLSQLSRFLAAEVASSHTRSLYLLLLQSRKCNHKSRDYFMVILKIMWFTLGNPSICTPAPLVPCGSSLTGCVGMCWAESCVDPGCFSGHILVLLDRRRWARWHVLRSLSASDSGFLCLSVCREGGFSPRKRLNGMWSSHPAAPINSWRLMSLFKFYFGYTSWIKLWEWQMLMFIKFAVSCSSVRWWGWSQEPI